MELIDFLQTYPFGYSTEVSSTAALFGVSIFIVYLIVLGLHRSISWTYYIVEPHWVFQAWMWMCLASIALIGQNWCYIIVAALFAVMTCNPTVNGGNIYFIPHMICATSAITLGLAGLPICYGIDYLVFPLIAATGSALIMICSKKNKYLAKVKIYFVEIICLSNLILGLASSIITCYE